MQPKSMEQLEEDVEALRFALRLFVKAVAPPEKMPSYREAQYIREKHGKDVLEAYWKAKEEIGETE